MGRVLTNNTAINYTVEAEGSLGELETSPIWKEMEPNAINAFSPQTTTVPRNPISRKRQRRKGATTDLDSTFETDVDLTMDSFEDFIRLFCFAQAQGPLFNIATPDIMDLYIKPSEATTTAYTIPTVAATLAERSLVNVNGFTNSVNNGLKQVATAGTTTSIPVEGGGLVAETPTDQQNVTLEYCGFRFSSGDLVVNSDGNLETTTKDLTELDLLPGQGIYLGGTLEANQFTEAANTGYARVVSVTANLMVLDNTQNTLVADTGASREVDMYFGPHIRNVAVGDSVFLERSIQFEGTFVNLDNPSGDVYRYSKGNYANTMAIELPLTNKATISFGFVGTDTTLGTTTRATNAANARQPVKTSAFNTSADIARLRVADLDNTGLTTDFKSLTLTINNNISPEKVLANLGGRFMNYGNIEIDVEAQMLFTDVAVAQAVRDNSTQKLDLLIRNDDGGIYVDLPEVTLGGGATDFPVNETVLINTTIQSHGDAVYDTSLLVTIFPYLPPIAA